MPQKIFDIFRSISQSVVCRRQRSLLKKKQEEYKARLMQDIHSLCAEMRNVDAAYNEVSDNDLIDSVIFLQSSLSCKHSYLMRLAREYASDNGTKYHG